MRRVEGASDDGFTLPELLVAITILGIIMVAIGAMITTSFRTSTTVSAELQGSRGPKVVSRYWVPDVEQAATVDAAAPCGDGDAIVTFGSLLASSAFDAPADATAGIERRVTWSEVTGPRDQLVRFVCDGTAAPDRVVVVSDLKARPTVDDASKPRVTLEVTVPDRSRTTEEYKFSVTGMAQVASMASAP
jgi:prepilin-type N-terminal cleavage/methylation domain-containing protein